MQTLILLSVSLGVAASSLSQLSETNNLIPQDENCDIACYPAYYHWMGRGFDIDSDTWIYQDHVHHQVASELCSTVHCYGCPFCALSQPLDEMAALLQETVATRHNADAEVSCMDCQDYLQACSNGLNPRVNETPEYRLSACARGECYAEQPSCPAHSVEERNYKGEFDCEYDMCINGPMHCREGGQCERRMCTDLARRNNVSVFQDLSGIHDTARRKDIHSCKDCTKLWKECLHNMCVPPNVDCLARVCTRADALPSFECSARCWSGTPTHCQIGNSCAHPVFATTGITIQTHPLTPMEWQTALLARGCNQFRDMCLETCDLQYVVERCERKCRKKYERGSSRTTCTSGCKERTCYQYCGEKTCCEGPHQCRKGAAFYRCQRLDPMDKTVLRDRELECKEDK
ncbi:hypothetical protein P153DRAFT_398318 [Dothidotthia symphoricarpi CBS 119687]|uniref:Uncharacterized protein n=1 Tax=Dothidotthia symphoricarpi CBS 119687 TaxID=1392245 RepID=A0A6A6AA42_9PLEO|nr:uncharacterized protein P153DRAFT_398318 [Dothidotthia symphoricarpi CBS 119687]KAF2127738.1 hypothetical protein P153DRAFT_398318 [Dothidotthia symphoricarpi CBS 119687]